MASCFTETSLKQYPAHYLATPNWFEKTKIFTLVVHHIIFVEARASFTSAYKEAIKEKAHGFSKITPKPMHFFFLLI